MKIYRLMSLFLTIPLAATLLAGCGRSADVGADGATSQNTDAKGRYIEKEIALPEEGSEAIGMFWKDDKLTVYMKSEKETPVYQSYTYENDAWSQAQEEQWMADASLQLQGSQREVVRLGQDGNIYETAETSSEDILYGSHIFAASEDGINAIDITPDSLLKENELGSSERFTDFDVLSDGTLALACMSNNKIKFYRDGEKIEEIEGQDSISDQMENISLSDDTVAIISADVKSVDFYNQKTLEKSGSVKLDFDEDELEYEHLAAGAEKDWYLADTKGIHRMREEGKILETIFDAKNGMMGLQNAEIRDFCVKDDNFYILYRISDTDEFHLQEYVYDAETQSVHSKNLSIYGLRESSTVSQAVQEFQRSHTDIDIDYKFAVGADQAPTSEDIRNLNAELLNKQGADILILDGLPLESYIEKGILSDLTELSDKLQTEGVLMEVIGNTAKRDTSIYALPARICVPYVYGTEEEKAAVQSLDSLHAYLEQHPDQDLFGRTFHNLLGTTLFSVMYDEIIGEAGTVDEKKLSECLKDWIQSCKASNTSEFERETGEGLDMKQAGIDFQSGLGLFGERFVSIEEGRGLASLMEPFSRMEKQGIGYDILKQLYIPKVIVGVNASSQNQELAKAFIESMYADAVQNTDTSEGFPVTEQGLKYQADYVDTDVAKKQSAGISYKDPITGEEAVMDIRYPARAAVEELNMRIRELKTPFRPDEMLMDTVTKEMENCYAGTKTPEEAARTISQKVDTYLSE